MRILSLDTGSSSLKFTLYDVQGTACAPVFSDELVDLDSSWNAQTVIEKVWSACGLAAAAADAAGHRIVFGGPEHRGPMRATPGLLDEIERYVPIEPLHLRSALDVIYEVARRIRDLPQVLCFDTAFHRSMPPIAKRFPLPGDIDPIVQRYGFHGLSYEYVVAHVREASIGRVVIAHLGNGASLAALANGMPIDTTMGFSPLGGLMMGTRPGDLDPGVLLYLLRSGYDAASLTELLNRRCGLAGVSGSTSSMQALLAAAATDARAAQAVDLFVYQLTKHIGGMIAALGGLDTLIFTGGIGEHAQPIRSRVEQALAYARCRTMVVRTDENLMIARHTAAMLASTGASR